MSAHQHRDEVEAGDRRVALAIAVNVLLTVAQVAGGIVSGSLALIADALHNLSDAASLAIAFVARRISRRPADGAMTFGYARAEVVAALVNYTTLILIGLYLVYEAVGRLIAPEPVAGWMVVVVAAVALVVDAVTALLTYRLSKTSMNIRAAFLHNVADALGSVGVIVAGTVILLYDWRLADPIVTLAIAAYILWQSLAEIGGVIRLLMLAAPAGLMITDVISAVKQVEGVRDAHHVHVWTVSEGFYSLEAHVVVADDHLADAQAIKRRIRAVLREDFRIVHSTLEIEPASERCEGDEALIIGHRHYPRHDP